MNGLSDLLFYFMCSLLFAHELDAIHKHEWRLVFILRKMTDNAARRAFVFLHIPLIGLIFWLVSHPNEAVRLWAVLSLDLFAVIHAGLHWKLMDYPKYEFNTMLSAFFIYGAAILAFIHLMLLLVGL